MKNKYKEFISVLIILFLYIGIFIKPTLIIESGINSINIFKTKLFPSIFPFFLLAYLLLDLGIADKISNKLSPIIKFLFHIDGINSFIILISIISGFPSGSKYITTIYNEKKISKDMANYLLTFTHFANPLFVLGTCSIILNNKFLAYKIFIIQLLSNIVLGIILRPKKIVNSKQYIKESNKTLIESLPDSINQSINLLLFMLGSITFFMFLSKLITSFFNFNLFFNVIITGILDLTSGISLIPTINTSMFFKGLLVLSFITFGSMSVHLQVINSINKTDLSYSNFFIGRIIQTAIASILYLIF